MIFLDVKTKISEQGKFSIQLSDVTEGEIGLVEFAIPNINQRGKPTNSLDLFCSEIDSSFENPKRLLKRLVFEEVHDKQNMNHWESNGVIQFKPISTFNNKLNFIIKRTFEDTVPRFHRSVVDALVLITIAIKPINSQSEATWIHNLRE